MSEYQYYEFRAIDRPLSKAEQAAVGRLSSRAEITERSFVNVYNYGDFRGNPETLVKRYYDAHLYLANWGTRHLMLKLPKAALDLKRARAYGDKNLLRLLPAGKNVVVAFDAGEREESEWSEGEGWLERLLPIRDELIRGDLRPLYLGWLVAAFYDEHGPDELEPPVPPGLGKLTAAQQALVEFLDVDRDLLKRAASVSAAAPPQPKPADLKAWASKQSAKDKDRALLELLQGRGEAHRARLLARFSKESAGPTRTAAAPRRRVADLLPDRGQA